MAVIHQCEFSDFNGCVMVVYKYTVLNNDGIANYQINPTWFRGKKFFVVYLLQKNLCDFFQNKNILRKSNQIMLLQWFLVVF